MLRDLADEHEPVALLIVDHNMPEMPGVDVLARAHELHPLAKRVLLVERDYSARSPVVQAMTLGQADYHLTKPWMRELDLYREISAFLADWAKDQDAGFELFQIIGRLHARSSHELRELLTRFNVPFRFHAVDSAQGRHLLENKGADAARLPVMIRHDGYTMVEPTPAQVIEAVGGTTHNDVDACDVVVVGAGPAGLTAAVYAASEGLVRTVRRSDPRDRDDALAPQAADEGGVHRLRSHRNRLRNHHDETEGLGVGLAQRAGGQLPTHQ